MSNVLGDLKNFLLRVTGVQTPSRNLGDPELCSEIVNIASTLLTRFPAAREAILFYFCQVVDDSVSLHFLQLISQGDNLTNKKWVVDQGTALDCIHKALSLLVHWNSKGWAPIISTWSLKLLGQLSSYHAPRLEEMHVPHILADILQVLKC